jgi:phosphate transport system permease protein
MSSASSAHRPGTPAAGGDAPAWPEVPVRRKISNFVFWGLCFLATALVIVPTVWLVAGVVAKAVPHFQWNVFTARTNGLSGGLQNAVLGTITISGFALILSAVISILTGLYLSEFARGAPRSVLRGGYEVLAGVPSIVLGYVGYVALVVGLGWKFGLLPAVLVMTVFAIPYITKATESALGQVPTAYREGAEALGLPYSWTLRKILLKTATPGIVTGVLVAAAISVGETAPLLYTANWSDLNPSLSSITHSGVGYLTYVTYYFAPINQVNAHANDLAYDSALILLVFVLILIIIGRVVITISRRNAE